MTKIEPVCPAAKLLGLANVQDDVFASVKAKLFEVAKSSVLVVSLAATEIAEMLPLAAATVISPALLIVMPPTEVSGDSTFATLSVDIDQEGFTGQVGFAGSLVLAGRSRSACLYSAISVESVTSDSAK